MSKTYKVNVNNTFDFDISSETISKLDILTISNSNFHILHNNKSHTAEITKADFYSKSYNIKVNNNTYQVVIPRKLDELIKNMGFETGNSKNIETIKAPMPGLIIDIYISEGIEVNENDPLLILEAMKMENIITSPRQGIIKSIHAKKGDAVNKNHILIEFEK